MRRYGPRDSNKVLVVNNGKNFPLYSVQIRILLVGHQSIGKCLFGLATRQGKPEAGRQGRKVKGRKIPKRRKNWKGHSSTTSYNASDHASPTTCQWSNISPRPVHRPTPDWISLTSPVLSCYIHYIWGGAMPQLRRHTKSENGFFTKHRWRETFLGRVKKNSCSLV